MTPSALPSAEPHSRVDDAQALLAGSLFVALGLAMYSHVGLLTGGVAGIAFLLRYATGWGFGPIFFVLNLPFYWLALRRLGWEFTLKTFTAISLISAFAAAAPWVLSFDKLNPVVAAVLGGFLIGFGALALLRHRASVGGVNILAQYLQQRRGISAGKIQMAVDCSIVAVAFLVVEPWKVALSVLGAVVLSAVLVFNHKPGRYLGV